MQLRNLRDSSKQQDQQLFSNQCPLDPALENAPVEDLRIRDVPCLFIFAVMWISVIIISGYSYYYGVPNNLIYPYDSTGYHCGISENYKNYPLVYYNINNRAQFVCINTCPPTKKSVNLSKCFYNNTSFNCSTLPPYASQKIVQICSPSSDPVTFQYDIGLALLQQQISDISNSYIASICVVVISFVFSYVMLFLARKLTAFVVYACLVLHILVLIALGVITYQMSIDPVFSATITDYSQLLEPSFLKVISYICWGTSVISFIFIMCSIFKIKTAIKILKLSTRFLQNKPAITLIPVGVTLIFFVFFSFFVSLFLYMFSSGSVISCTGSPYGCVNWDLKLRRYFGFTLFTFIWTSIFIVNLTQYLISSVTAYWYFEQNIQSTITRSIKKLLGYHLGSIAFGSLILTIMSIFKILLQVFYRHRKKTILNNAPFCTRFMENCCLCFTCFFQKILQFATNNAYIMMAISGQSFLRSAESSFYLIKRHTRSYLITHELTSVTTIFLMLFTASVSSFLGYIIITQIPYFSNNLYSPTFPTLFFFIISMVISSIFMDVLGYASDSILICYYISKQIKKHNQNGNNQLIQQQLAQ